MKKRLIRFSAVAAGLIATMIFGWAWIDSALVATGGNEFCTSCHSMRPIAYSYRKDVHGGNSSSGVAVPCAECHLPHSSHMAYLSAKVRLGIHDFFVENFGSPDKIDWTAKLERREEYTYDEGCLKCHNFLERAPMPNNRAVIAHKPYFLGKSDKTCVSCHPHVGHKMLFEFIQEHQYKKEP